mgnify:CR=1 FL=1
MMIFGYIIIALLISFLSFEVLKINYKPNKANYQLISTAFLLGAVMGFLGYTLNRHFGEQIFYAIKDHDIKFVLRNVYLTLVQISILIVGFLTFIKFVAKSIDKPIDYLVYFLSIAIGLSVVENVLHLCENTSAVSPFLIFNNFIVYLFSLSPIGYYLLMNRYRKNEDKAYNAIVCFSIAIVSIAIFRIVNISLINEDELLLSFIFSTSFFFTHISFLANTIKNALNISPSFTYKRINNPKVIITKLIFIFVLIFLIQIVQITIDYSLEEALFFAITGSLYILPMLYLTTKILSRIKIIKNHWSPLKLELPYRLPPMGLGLFDDDTDELEVNAKRKLETSTEMYITSYYQEFFMLHLYPYTEEKSLAYIEEKFFFTDESSFFLARIYESDENSPYQYVILMPKAGTANYAFDKYLLIAIMHLEQKEGIENFTNDHNSFSFENWGIIINMDDEFSVYPE